MHAPSPGRLASRCRALAPAALLLALFASAVPAPGPGFAAGTDPSLALTRADAFAASTGSLVVQVSGTFNFDDAMQFTFPAGLIVYQGTHFARFDFSGAKRQGTAASLVDGLADTELAALLAQGSQAAAPASVLQLQPSNIRVVLPPDFTPGVASVVVYAVLENTSFLSNTLSVTIPGP